MLPIHFLTVKPTEVSITQLSPILVADRDGVLECTTFGSRPRAVIYWLFNGQKYSTPLTVGSLGEHQTSTTITIAPREEHDGSEIMCVAENPKIASSGVSAVMRLDVQYIPKIRLELGSPKISIHSIQEGNDVFFDCHIQSNPPPNKGVVWRFNGQVLETQKGQYHECFFVCRQRVFSYSFSSLLQE